ncbi:MAG: copper resistance protein B [Desulfobacteraceae bacterium]|jgi:copper resistance protein B|nr:copper resistance protein B [Desulfobacteraceae bacterium]
MKTWIIFLIIAFLPAVAPAAAPSSSDSGQQGFPADYHEVDTDPKVGQKVRKYAEDDQKGAQKNFGRQFVHDNQIFAVFRADRLEYQTGEGNETVLWDVQAWAGSDYNKLWFKSEGTWLIDPEKFEEAETELFYSRNIAAFWDLQIGVRHDFKPDPDRTFAALGFQGLAPYRFEVEATAYISEDGDLSAALETEYDLLLSQRLILQPRFETRVAVQEVKKYGIGQGINDIELGARLRYEIRREFAPYIGVSWHRKLGETADLAEDEGEDTDVISFVAGIKLWF